jgi:hypothetical protein
MIKTEEINRIKDVTISMMKQNFKNDGKLFPVIMALEASGKMNYIGTPFRNQEEKMQTLRYAKELCKKINAVAFFMITEAWFMKATPEEYKKYIEELQRTGKRVGDYNDKKEVVILLFETKTSSTTYTFDIDRQKNELINMNYITSGDGDFKNILCEIQTNTN